MGTQSSEKSLDDIRMSSNELINKKVIDSGGFGKVFLCYHRDHGLVVQKTVYTGFKQDSYKNDLFQEGKIMNRLNHDRVVKLLGIILEDCNYSLVIEYMTKGNLLSVLKQTQVPDSVKARFILEIIEGMVYLHSQKVIHKDLKPENILANDDFHVKIADLGVAAFQKWSCLTREETNRQRNRSRKSDTANGIFAGTISYMAPEHFKSINMKATEKSDVYSFAIVIWVILSNTEPYEDAINDVQLSVCVREGQRPEIADGVSLKEATELMEDCWKDEPNDRPSFQDCEKRFKPVYTEKYEKYIEKDMTALIKSYPPPEEFITRMASLQLDCDAEPPSMPVRDVPMSLHSSMGLAEGNVDENLFAASNNEPVEQEEEKPNDTLQRKLQEEMNYHLTGSRIENVTDPSIPATSSGSRSQRQFNDPTSMSAYNPGSVRPFNVPLANQQPIPASAEMYGSPTYNAEYVMPSSYPIGHYPHFPATNNSGSAVHNQYEQYEIEPHPGSRSFASHNSTKPPVAESEWPDHYPHSFYGTNASHPEGAVGNNVFPKGNFEYSSLYNPEKSVNLTISNSKAVQIGNNNYMVVEGGSGMKHRQVAQNPPQMQNQNIFENNTLLNEHQLQLLRDNLSKKWKEFARKVGFSEPEIDEIDYDYERDGLKEKVVQMLHKWQMKEGSKNATVGKVAKALHILEETYLLNKLIHLNQAV